MSGLSRTPGKRVWANTHRGFESRPLRQSTIGPSGPVLLSGIDMQSGGRLQFIPGKTQFVALPWFQGCAC